MKQQTQTLIYGFLVLLISLNSVSCSESIEPRQQNGRNLVLDAPLVNGFTIDNQSSHTIGSVTLAGGGNSIDVQVDGIGVYTPNISWNPVSATIANHVCPYPSTTVVSMPEGGSISVGWTAPGIIAIIDYGAQN